MSEISTPELGYNWFDYNPSQEAILPLVRAAHFNVGGLCSWIAEPSTDSAEMLSCAEDLFAQEFPRLYTEAESLAVLSFDSTTILNNLEDTMFHYRRGVTMALIALDLGPQESTRDLGTAYLERFSNLDTIEKHYFVESLSEKSFSFACQLYGFIRTEYANSGEYSSVQIAATARGARNAYCLAAHSRACRLREEELAWLEHEEYKNDYLYYKAQT